jgi:hypothetical protein
VTRKTTRFAKCSAAVLLCAGVVGSNAGCANNTETGALAGGLGGAAVGGLIGSNSHARAGEGALIGAAVGAIGGALVGHAMDKSDEKDAREAESKYARDDHPKYADSSTVHDHVTTKDVINWTARGTRDEIIIDRVERSSTVFHLTAADENQLRDAGVSESVIRSMKDTARR